MLMYYLIGQIPVLYNDASIESHSHYPLSLFLADIPTIRLAILRHHTSSTAIIASVTTQIFLPYRSTTWTTTFYIISHALIGAPVFSSTFSTTPHLL